MKLRVLTEPQQGATYETILTCARAVEELGFDGFFRSDHYLRIGEGDGHPGPTDAWITLAGLARDTERIRLGTLVSPATFRLPGPLAIQVAQVDAMSAGRVELGLGAGWYRQEHAACGIPFPRNRFDHLEEQLEIITGLWRTPVGRKYSHTGKLYSILDSPALPKPVQNPGPPIIVGGTGQVRTPFLAAKYADEYNVAFRSVEDTATAYQRARRACVSLDRDPDTLVLSATLLACAGTTAAEVALRAHAMGRDLTVLRTIGLAGTPGELRERVAAYQAIGTRCVYIRILDMSDLGHLQLLASSLLKPGC